MEVKKTVVGMRKRVRMMKEADRTRATTDGTARIVPGWVNREAPINVKPLL
jgi:hypothetical protein